MVSLTYPHGSEMYVVGINSGLDDRLRIWTNMFNAIQSQTMK